MHTQTPPEEQNTPLGLRERLAELEHEQWIKWSQNIATTESITPERRERWNELWRPYSNLTEAEKDQDREWADKVLAILSEQRTALIDGVRVLFKDVEEREDRVEFDDVKKLLETPNTGI